MPFTLNDDRLAQLRAAPLVDADRVFALIKRSFSGRAVHVLGELLQNAQRAGARHVAISFPDGYDAPTRDQPDQRTSARRFVYHDDGAGLDDGPFGLLTLLGIGLSRYDDPEVARNQEPFGVGFYSLLASDAVSRVTLRSNDVALTLEPARWWSDPTYRSSWLTLLRPLDPPAPGFALEVEAGAAFVRACAVALDVVKEWPGGQVKRALDEHPALGYGDLLDVTIDGAPYRGPAERDLDPVTLPEASTVTEYAGNELRVGLGSAHGSRAGRLVVNWYGQLIAAPLWGLPGGVRAYYAVRTGRPLTPRWTHS